MQTNHRVGQEEDADSNQFDECPSQYSAVNKTTQVLQKNFHLGCDYAVSHSRLGSTRIIYLTWHSMCNLWDSDKQEVIYCGLAVSAPLQELNKTSWIGRVDQIPIHNTLEDCGFEGFFLVNDPTVACIFSLPCLIINSDSPALNVPTPFSSQTDSYTHRVISISKALLSNHTKYVGNPFYFNT